MHIAFSPREESTKKMSHIHISQNRLLIICTACQQTRHHQDKSNWRLFLHCLQAENEFHTFKLLKKLKHRIICNVHEHYSSIEGLSWFILLYNWFHVQQDTYSPLKKMVGHLPIIFEHSLKQFFLFILVFHLEVLNVIWIALHFDSISILIQLSQSLSFPLPLSLQTKVVYLGHSSLNGKIINPYHFMEKDTMFLSDNAIVGLILSNIILATL